MHMDLPELIYPSVQMPIFFFLSGTFYHAKKPTLWQQMKSDAYKLLLPTVCFMAIAAILLIIKGDDCWSWNVINVIQNLRNSSITWFLIALFSYRAINYLFHRFKSRIWLLFVATLVYPIGFWWKVKYPDVVVPIIPLQEMFMFGIYYALGYCFGRPILELSHIRGSALLHPIVWLCIGYLVLVHLLYWESGFLQHIPWLAYGFPYTVACIYLGLILGRLIEKIQMVSPVLTYIGRNSIVFYLTHWPLWIFLFKPLAGNPYLVFLTITIMEFPLIYLFTHYFPWMIGQYKKIIC